MNKTELLNEMKSLPNIHEEIPDEIVALVEQVLLERQKGGKQKSKTVEKQDQRIMLNIWDFAGHSIYHTTHQVNNMSCGKE